MLLACFWALAAAPSDPDRLVRAVLAAHPEVVAADAARTRAEHAEHAVPGWMPLRAELMIAPTMGMPSAQLSQMTMPLGEAAAERQMRRADTAMATVDARMTRVELAVRAAGLWADWYGRNAQLALIDAGVQTLGQLESSSRERYARGLGSLADARMAHEELAMLQLDRVMLAGDLDEARIGLLGLLGEPLDGALTVPAGVPVLPLPTDPRPVAVEAAQAGVDEADAAVLMARRQRLPALGWMASWEEAGMSAVDGLMVGAMVEVPLDVSVRAAAVATAEADRTRAASSLEAARRQSDTELAQALAMVRAQSAVVQGLDADVLPAAQASVAAARTAYEAGHDDAQMLLMALHRLHDVQIEVASAHAELYKRQAMAWMAAGTLPPAWEGAP